MHSSRYSVHWRMKVRKKQRQSARGNTAPNRGKARANVPYTSDGIVSINEAIAVECQRFDFKLQFLGPLMIPISLGGGPFDMQLPQTMVHLEKQGAVFGCEHVTPHDGTFAHCRCREVDSPFVKFALKVKEQIATAGLWPLPTDYTLIH